MKIWGTESGEEKQSMSAPVRKRRSLLILAGLCLTFLVGQEQPAQAIGFSATGSMGTARQFQTATLLDTGGVLVAGGSNNSSALSSAELYNPANRSFAATTGAMSDPRWNHTATKLDNGLVLIAGGISGSITLNGAELYNPATGTFSPTGVLGTARQLHTATRLANGTVLIAGGRSGSNSGSTLNKAEIYDPATGTFSTTGDMQVSRAFHTATLLNDGRVLITGGLTTGLTSLGSAEIYDPATGQFTLTGSMTVARNYHAAVLLQDGTVLITGGSSGSANNPSLTSAEIFGPGTGTFALTKDPSSGLTTVMGSGHSKHTATLLLSGNVLIAGDASLSGVIGNSAEIYHPTNQVFLSVSPMVTERANYPALLLADGTVLLAGGVASSGTTALAETYNPAAIAVTPVAFTFPATPVNGTSAPQTFTISNSDESPVVVNSIDMSGADTPLFTVTASTCGTMPHTLAANGANGSTCTVSVTFKPDSGGIKSGSLDISSDDQELPLLSVPLTNVLPDVTPPSDGTLVANPGDQQVALSWSGFSDSETGIASYKLVADPAGVPADCAGTAVFSGAGTSFTHTGLVNLTTYFYRVCAIDNAGNVSAGATASATPTAPPVTLTVFAPVKGGTVTGPGIACPGDCSETYTNGTQVTLTAAASLPGYQFAGWTGACAAFGTTPVCTTAALIANASVTAAFADTTAPVLVLSTLSNGAVTSGPTLNITGDVTDNNAIQSFTINGKPVAFDAGGSFSYPLKLAVGANIITSEAADPAGNKTSDVRTITLDAAVPLLTVTAPADNSTSNKLLVTVSGTIDPASTVDISVNGGAPQSAAITDTAFTLDVNLSAGLNTLEITATDLAGKKNTLKRSVVSNSQNPTIALTDPGTDIVTTQAGITIKGSIADALEPVTVSVTSGADTFTPVVSGGAFEQAVTFPAAGIYPLIIKVTEVTENTTTIQRNIIYELPNGINPVVTPTNVKTQTVTGVKAAGTTVAVTCATATVGTVTYPSSPATATTWSVTLTGLAEGANSITATFTNPSGPVTTAQTTIVVDSLAPVNGTFVAVAGINQVNLSWTGFTDPVIGIDSYKLVYATNASPASCSTGTLIYSGSTTSYLHTGLVKGTTYFYRLCAVDKLANTSSGVTAKAKLTLSPLVITTASPLASGTYGVNYTKNVAATGGLKPYVWSVISGALPAGVAMNPVNGALRGKPTEWGDFNFTAQVVDKQGNTTTKDISMTVVVPQLVITSPSLPAGRTGIAYKKVLAAKGGVKPTYSWSVVSGTLPDGLTLDAATGIISGTPVSPVTSAITIQLTDARNLPVTKDYTLIVK